MKQKTVGLLAILLLLIACQKDNVPQLMGIEPPPVSPTIQKPENLLAKGTFQSAVHTTSGEIKVYRDENGKRALIFENFRTDSGPDLRIYMAEDKALTNFIEVSNKVNTMGNYSVALPDEADLSKHTYVLIWCKRFAVLFGSAELKPN
ncbi:DM13 domain-containing protein [Emticicia agri]|uniref:DM13 domain-containing protein n=1 Tax=Emticicia agri TaxID=2492393 RepID=A0A4Q5LR54_9BACT|nr:DM13 domain-containing protein [Emticicia agri]RYU91833.1 hypothetical protein EWM59_26535 [Emticicia agri]